MLRIDVDNVTARTQHRRRTLPGRRRPAPSTASADNPFVANTSIHRICAYGLGPAYLRFDARQRLRGRRRSELFEEVDIVTRGGNTDGASWRAHCFGPRRAPRVPPAACPTDSSSGDPLIGPIIEGGHDLGVVFVGGGIYNGTTLPDLRDATSSATGATTSPPGMPTLLAATPPEGWDPSAVPDSAENLTPENIAMWRLERLNVNGTPAGTVEAFLLGFGVDESSEIYVLTTDDGGPDASNMTGRVWKLAPANVTATPTATPTTAPPRPLPPGWREM